MTVILNSISSETSISTIISVNTNLITLAIYPYLTEKKVRFEVFLP